MEEGKKVKAVVHRKGDKIEITGLDRLLGTLMDVTIQLCDHQKFVEDVLLACAMPDTPRYSIQYDGEDENISSAESALYKRMEEWRKMTAWFRANNIDLDAVLGRDGNDKKKKRS